MKTKFTSHVFRYFTLTCVLAYLSLNLPAQTSFKVAASSFQFSPKDLTITAGDTVIWTNSGGTHNVDGKTSVFPLNPVSFGNDVGSGWTYKFVFNTAGTYDYQCDPHASLGMVGKIVVNPKSVTSSQILADGTEKLFLYPNPATQNIELFVPRKYEPVISLKVYSITGELCDQKIFSENSGSLKLDISNYKNGIYMMEINAGNQKNVLKFIKQ